MSKNHTVKSRKNKVALPPTNPGPLNVVTFSFRLQNSSQPQEVLKNEEGITQKQRHQ